MTSRSKEISFSRTRDFRAVRSMSIRRAPSPARRCPSRQVVLGQVVLGLGLESAELDLHARPGHRRQRQLAGPAVDVQGDGVLGHADHPAGDRSPVGEHGADQPAGRPAPVPGQRERAVHARRGHLEGVRLAAQGVLLVQPLGQLLADHGDVVERDAAVLVDDHAEHPPAAGRGHLALLEVQPGGGHHGGDHGAYAIWCCGAHGPPLCGCRRASVPRSAGPQA